MAGHVILNPASRRVNTVSMKQPGGQHGNEESRASDAQRGIQGRDIAGMSSERCVGRSDALRNGLNANLVHRWRRLEGRRGDAGAGSRVAVAARSNAEFELELHRCVLRAATAQEPGNPQKLPVATNVSFRRCNAAYRLCFLPTFILPFNFRQR